MINLSLRFFEKRMYFISSVKYELKLLSTKNWEHSSISWKSKSLICLSSFSKSFKFFFSNFITRLEFSELSICWSMLHTYIQFILNKLLFTWLYKVSLYNSFIFFSKTVFFVKIKVFPIERPIPYIDLKLPFREE